MGTGEIRHEDGPGPRAAGVLGAAQSAIPEVSVVVPVYRNADTLPELQRRLCRVLDGVLAASESADQAARTFEIIYVDDACPGGSLPVLESLAREDHRVQVLSLAHNVGQHRAVLAGLSYARGTWTVVMDADLQDPPEAIPSLLHEGRRGSAAVFAGRRGEYESPTRLLTSRLFKWLMHLLCGLPKDAGIFVALHRSAVERVLAIAGRRPFVVAVIGCTDLQLTSLPVRRARRPYGSSTYSVLGRLRSAWRGIEWVLRWKWRRFWGQPPEPGEVPAARAYRGARFDSCSSFN
jgi:polyisoprenyl-phosphate glycosyltransferase